MESIRESEEWPSGATATRSDPAVETVSPGEIAEAASLLCRLAHRSRRDSLMCRAASRLQRDPALPLDQLASQLGVGERYLVNGLRQILGTDPHRLAHLAPIAQLAGHRGIPS